MDGCRGARRPLWMAVVELGGHCGWLLWSSEAVVDGLGELGGRCEWLYVSLEAIVDGLGELGGHCGWLRGAWRSLWMA